MHAPARAPAQTLRGMAVAPKAPAARARAAPARIQAAGGTQVIQVFSKEKLVRPKITEEKKAPRILARVQELRLLSKLEKAGLLSVLEKNGLTLSAIESSGLLSLAEKFGLVSAAADRCGWGAWEVGGLRPGQARTGQRGAQRH